MSARGSNPGGPLRSRQPQAHQARVQPVSTTAQGLSAKQAQDATQSVIEGIPTCKSVFEGLITKYEIEMPITTAVYDVIFKGKPVRQAIEDLMTRELKPEITE